MTFERNIPLLYAYSVLIKRVSMPIIIVYFLLHQLSYSQIGLLASVMSILALLTEVHGGVFADVHGKKWSLILHSLFGLITMFLYFVGNNFWFFLAASISYGIAGAFISGTRNALLYDTLVQLSKANLFKKYNGRIVLYSHVINAGILLLIPVLYEINVKLPFIIGVFFFLGSLLVASFFTEPPLTKKSEKKFMYSQRIGVAIKEIASHKYVMGILFLTILTGAFLFMSSEFIQPLLLIAELPVIAFGVVYALMRVLMGFGAEIVHRLEHLFSVERLLVIGLCAIAIGFLGFWVGSGLIIVGAVLLRSMADGFNRIVLEDEINKFIGSQNRTTILSISSLLKQLCNAILVFAFGVAADLVGVQEMFLFVLVLFVLLAIGLFSYSRAQKIAV